MICIVGGHLILPQLPSTPSPLPLSPTNLWLPAVAAAGDERVLLEDDPVDSAKPLPQSVSGGDLCTEWCLCFARNVRLPQYQVSLMKLAVIQSKSCIKLHNRRGLA